MKLKTSESSSYDNLWEVMNDLEMVTSKIVSAREIIDTAAEAIQRNEYDKAETLAMAAYEFLGYYLEEFDEKFKLAWNETVLKRKKEKDDGMHPWGHSELYDAVLKEQKYTDDELAAMCDAAENKSWTAPIEVDPNGEWYITFPDDLIDKLGWRENDTLEWIDNKDGTFSIKKVESDD